MIHALFATLELAARMAMMDAFQCGQRRQECGGVIYQVPGGFRYSQPETQGEPFGVNITALLAKPGPGETLVGEYHNHLCVGDHQLGMYFSPQDAAVAKGFRIVSYILDECDGNIRKLDPTQDDMDDFEVDFADGRRLYLTMGHVCGWLPLP